MKLALHEYHQKLGARFTELNGMELVEDYGDWLTEYAALRTSAGLLDLGFRGRLCVTGADRKRFLHGQVTNEVNALAVGEGCYSALTTAKGKIQSDLSIYCLTDELLLDFEPGFSQTVVERLEKYIIADDAQVIDVASDYGLMSVQGPAAGAVLARAGFLTDPPPKPLSFTKLSDAAFGESYCMNRPRTASEGFDLFIPAAHLQAAAERLLAATNASNRRACGWRALETVRVEAGIPRFGADMDETNLPPEAGIEPLAVSYTKGCYIGQEVIARIRTYGQVAKKLKRLTLSSDIKELPKKGDKLFHGEKEAGYITSTAASPTLKNIALGYVRREFLRAGTELRAGSPTSDIIAIVLGD